MKRVLIGCPLWNSEWVLDKWLSAVTAQRTTDIEITTAFIVSPSEDGTEKLLRDDPRVDWIIRGPISPRTVNDHINHIWGVEHYKHMAKVRNMLVSWAQKQGVHYFFSLDSDIIIPPGTVDELIKVMDEEKYNAISPLVNMAPPGMEDDAYNYMFWLKRHTGEIGTRVSALTPVALVHSVDVIMAAMLMDKKAMSARWYFHDQGEDIGWSADAHRRDLQLAIHKGIEAEHLVKRF